MIRKLNVISNFMTSHTGKQVIIIHILPNISRSKGNQAIKFSHLIAYKGRNIFLQKSLDFQKTRLGHIITAKFIIFKNVHPVICSILILLNGIRTRFFKKNISHFIF